MNLGLKAIFYEVAFLFLSGLLMAQEVPKLLVIPPYLYQL